MILYSYGQESCLSMRENNLYIRYQGFRNMAKNTIIDGIAASEHLDSSGESLSIEGMDISSLGGPDSILNWEHGSKDRPSQVVGKVTFAKKIMKESDAKTKREKYFWNKTKKPMVYIKAELFDGVGHSGAQDVAAMLKYNNKDKGEDSRLVVGFSIEGGKMEKKGMVVTKSIARDVAITVKPCNKVCDAELIEDDVDEDFLYKNQEFDCEIIQKGGLNLRKSFRELILGSIEKSHFDLEQKNIHENKADALKTVRNLKTREKVPVKGRGTFSVVKDAGDKVVKELRPKRKKIASFSDETIDSDLERQVINSEYPKESGRDTENDNFGEIYAKLDLLGSNDITDHKTISDLKELLTRLKREINPNLKLIHADSQAKKNRMSIKKSIPSSNNFQALAEKMTNTNSFKQKGAVAEKIGNAANSKLSLQPEAKPKRKYDPNPNPKRQFTSETAPDTMKVGDRVVHDRGNKPKTGKDIYNDPDTFSPKNSMRMSEKNNMRKALMAGMMGGSPDSKTGGAALAQEDLSGTLEKPFRSKKQRRFAHANPEKFGGKEGIKEWEEETPKNIPEKVKKNEKELNKSENFKAPTFTTKTTGMSGYDEMMQNPDHYRDNKGVHFEIKNMHPEEYINIVAKDYHNQQLGTKYEFPSVEHAKQSLLNQRRNSKNMQKVKNFDVLHMPVLDFKNQWKMPNGKPMIFQEGLHRTIHALDSGLQSIPVLMVRKHK